VALDGDQRHIEVGETAGEDDGERHVGYYWSRTAMPRTASLLRRECPNLAPLVRHTLNRGSLLEGPLTDRIPDSGNPGCQGQVATISAVRPLSRLVSCGRAADTRPECVPLKPSLSSGRVHLLSWVRSTRALQDCSDRVLAEPDMAADQPVAQTSLCQLEDLRRLAVRWTLSWLAAEL
jgi:hypothetical protein